MDNLVFDSYARLLYTKLLGRLTKTKTTYKFKVLMTKCVITGERFPVSLCLQHPDGH